VIWNVVRRPWQPGHVNGFIPTKRASPPRSVICAGNHEQTLAVEAITADAVAMGIELAQRVEHDEISGGHKLRFSIRSSASQAGAEGLQFEL
jgi:hypothetical protein